MSKTSITGPWFKTTKDRLEESKKIMKNRGKKMVLIHIYMKKNIKKSIVTG